MARLGLGFETQQRRLKEFFSKKSSFFGTHLAVWRPQREGAAAVKLIQIDSLVEVAIVQHKTID